MWRKYKITSTKYTDALKTSCEVAYDIIISQNRRIWFILSVGHYMETNEFWKGKFNHTVTQPGHIGWN